MLYRIMENKNKNRNTSTAKKKDNLVRNVDTKQREEIKKKLIFGDILTRSVEEGYKSLRKKDKKEFSNIILTEKERFKKHKLLTQTNIFKVRNTKEN